MIAQIYLWDVYVGALNWNPQTQVGEFEYTPEFVRTGLEISPVHMPLRSDYIYVFQGLDRETFKGLPSILADSLPDDFGNALIDAWLAQQGRSKATFTPVERLLYQGERGMGALEYRPALATERDKAESIQIDALVRLASEVLSDRESIAERLNAHDPSVDDAALQHLIQIGTSAGGARAKAVIAIDGQGEIRSGQVTAPSGFEYWLLKFDVAKDSKLLADSQGYGRIEYAYHLMAKAAGISMTECRLLEEGGRAHFMTKRFDRTAEGEKIHVATLCALDHADFRKPGQYSYAEAFGVMRALRISRDGAEQFYRRMVFNLVARNQDDHTKNTAFMMDTDGTWYLTPAYDVSYSYLPGSFWVDTHQMTVNGKRDDFTLDDLLSVASQVRGMDARRIIKEVCEAVAQWPRFAREAGVPATASERIGETHRLYLGEGL
ncbi:type II toxin-antitoxin system HipA family toxin [Pseudomonas sichuanensis]|uniref:type II toxin-antitoxin system HipA family toxin n=1 Tax=Pseudomonas sichuanensis TaxID=2213015 RepID=UPI00244A7BB0|nr:type II toxin-antitoxin system HipA family toxin [Pseudomonas sichuanensis]MDH0732923.1 type II toxin-antitoxin system HipA family toxin [Pseudomonas sichuanensis]MDH1581947.1 type II toxin-antitoxin system HipA family toxin [Pseudomonas sichuanensis]MDH1591375.1 type II toxin-antitoxin system HipA family toxin [Pseudomonas sichuanensis]MDH1597015.1 type II toxin-antitoxin system HipA family toxin [Pseudomonas sichuanensis]